MIINLFFENLPYSIKNLFGCIPGLKKSAFHLRFPGRAEFAAMLADFARQAELDLESNIASMDARLSQWECEMAINVKDKA